VAKVALCSTDNRETAEFWRSELSAGRFPRYTEDEP
jgi:hypothetical protein